METEKKIVRETIELQKKLVTFKDYCRNSPREISTMQKYLLILEIAKVYREASSFIIELESLLNLLESTAFTKLDIETDRLKLKLIDTMIVAIEAKINNTLGNNEESKDFEVED